jgi:hypothetical protein
MLDSIDELNLGRSACAMHSHSNSIKLQFLRVKYDVGKHKNKTRLGSAFGVWVRLAWLFLLAVSSSCSLALWCLVLGFVLGLAFSPAVLCSLFSVFSLRYPGCSALDL